MRHDTLSQSREETFDIFHIDTKVRSSIEKAIISPNDDVTAFFLFCFGESLVKGERI